MSSQVRNSSSTLTKSTTPSQATLAQQQLLRQQAAQRQAAEQAATRQVAATRAAQSAASTASAIAAAQALATQQAAQRAAAAAESEGEGPVQPFQSSQADSIPNANVLAARAGGTTTPPVTSTGQYYSVALDNTTYYFNSQPAANRFINSTTAAALGVPDPSTVNASPNEVSTVRALFSQSASSGNALNLTPRQASIAIGLGLPVATLGKSLVTGNTSTTQYPVTNPNGTTSYYASLSQAQAAQSQQLMNTLTTIFSPNAAAPFMLAVKNTDGTVSQIFFKTKADAADWVNTYITGGNAPIFNIGNYAFGTAQAAVNYANSNLPAGFNTPQGSLTPPLAGVGYSSVVDTNGVTHYFALDSTGRGPGGRGQPTSTLANNFITSMQGGGRGPGGRSAPLAEISVGGKTYTATTPQGAVQNAANDINGKYLVLDSNGNIVGIATTQTQALKLMETQGGASILNPSQYQAYASNAADGSPTLAFGTGAVNPTIDQITGEAQTTTPVVASQKPTTPQAKPNMLQQFYNDWVGLNKLLNPYAGQAVVFPTKAEGGVSSSQEKTIAARALVTTPFATAPVIGGAAAEGAAGVKAILARFGVGFGLGAGTTTAQGNTDLTSIVESGLISGGMFAGGDLVVKGVSRYGGNLISFRSPNVVSRVLSDEAGVASMKTLSKTDPVVNAAIEQAKITIADDNLEAAHTAIKNAQYATSIYPSAKNVAAGQILSVADKALSVGKIDTANGLLTKAADLVKESNTVVTESIPKAVDALGALDSQPTEEEIYKKILDTNAKAANRINPYSVSGRVLSVFNRPVTGYAKIYAAPTGPESLLGQDFGGIKGLGADALTSLQQEIAKSASDNGFVVGGSAAMKMQLGEGVFGRAVGDVDLDNPNVSKIKSFAKDTLSTVKQAYKDAGLDPNRLSIRESGELDPSKGWYPRQQIYDSVLGKTIFDIGNNAYNFKVIDGIKVRPLQDIYRDKLGIPTEKNVPSEVLSKAQIDINSVAKQFGIKLQPGFGKSTEVMFGRGRVSGTFGSSMFNLLGPELNPETNIRTITDRQIIKDFLGQRETSGAQTTRESEMITKVEKALGTVKGTVKPTSGIFKVELNEQPNIVNKTITDTLASKAWAGKVENVKVFGTSSARSILKPFFRMGADLDIQMAPNAGEIDANSLAQKIADDLNNKVGAFAKGKSIAELRAAGFTNEEATALSQGQDIYGREGKTTTQLRGGHLTDIHYEGETPEGPNVNISGLKNTEQIYGRRVGGTIKMRTGNIEVGPKIGIRIGRQSLMTAEETLARKGASSMTPRVSTVEDILGFGIGEGSPESPGYTSKFTQYLTKGARDPTTKVYYQASANYRGKDAIDFDWVGMARDFVKTGGRNLDAFYSVAKIQSETGRITDEQFQKITEVYQSFKSGKPVEPSAAAKATFDEAVQNYRTTAKASTSSQSAYLNSIVAKQAPSRVTPISSNAQGSRAASLVGTSKKVSLTTSRASAISRSNSIFNSITSSVKSNASTGSRQSLTSSSPPSPSIKSGSRYPSLSPPPSSPSQGESPSSVSSPSPSPYESSSPSSYLSSYLSPYPSSGSRSDESRPYLSIPLPSAVGGPARKRRKAPQKKYIAKTFRHNIVENIIGDIRVNQPRMPMIGFKPMRNPQAVQNRRIASQKPTPSKPKKTANQRRNAFVDSFTHL